MTETTESNRIVFLDWLRVIACLMVMTVHACEAFYFGDDGSTTFRTLRDAQCATWIDSAMRAAVPLFVMASSFLLFPLRRTTGDFFRRRLVRVGVPFLVWSLVFIGWNAWTPGAGFDLAAAGANLAKLLFNFPMTTGGHMWFVPMLFGLYLLMPLLSPWAEKASEKEVRGWLALWFFTTLFPFIRKLWAVWFASGVDPATGTWWAHTFGSGNFSDLPFLWGECPWNAFGAFQYVSGFFGYLLLGFYFRRFAGMWSARKTLLVGGGLWAAGYAIAAGFFWGRIPFDGTFPLVRPYAFAVDLEMSWEFCGLGVALTVVGYFLLIRRFACGGRFYEKVIRPLSEASYGTYLMHMILLTPIVRYLHFAAKGPHLATPLAIVLTAVGTFAGASLVSLALRRVPRVGKYLVG